MMNDRPIIIVITPVRNEAWVLDAYLACASSWADYIILADQHSSDGTREIASKYDKVILIDNELTEMNQAAARLLLFEAVDRIEGDKIVFALDADEFLSEGFDKTEGWQRIIHSRPNEIFCFRWLNLYGDFQHSGPDTGFMEWACHFSSTTSIAAEYQNCERRAVHEMRIPCLPSDRVSYVRIEDIRFVHLARVNSVRQKNKEAFYQVSSVAKLNKRISAVSLYRSYNLPSPQLVSLEKPVSLYVVDDAGDAGSRVMMGDIGQYYLDEMLHIFQREGYEKFLKLDIWDNPYLIQAGAALKVPFKYRVLHAYLRKTQPFSDRKVVRLMDRVLKVFV